MHGKYADSFFQSKKGIYIIFLEGSRMMVTLNSFLWLLLLFIRSRRHGSVYGSCRYVLFAVRIGKQTFMLNYTLSWDQIAVACQEFFSKFKPIF